MRPAPELITDEWFNSEPLTLEQLRGKVVVLHAFQMLCPGCVQTGIPQAAQVHQLYDRNEVAVIGLHSVFEHHHVMTPEALKVFMHEYRIRFPVAVDRPGVRGNIPQTMSAYEFQGTPSLALIDKRGQLRWTKFGHAPDLALGSAIGQLLSETTT
ncbi:thioredoxin domain-containing protein [Chitinimonas naiadis]